MNLDEINELNSEYYPLATSRLKALLSKGILPAQEINQILNLKNTLIISDFLIEYKRFSKRSISTLHKYIIKNLDNTNKLFVSDLIEFADDWDLELPYTKCIKFLNEHNEDNTYV